MVVTQDKLHIKEKFDLRNFIFLCAAAPQLRVRSLIYARACACFIFFIFLVIYLVG